MFPPEVAAIKSNQQPFLPVDGLVSFDPECAAAISLVSCEAVNGDFPVPAFRILLVFKKLKDREKRPCLRILGSPLALCRTRGGWPGPILINRCSFPPVPPTPAAHPLCQVKGRRIWKGLQGTLGTDFLSNYKWAVLLRTLPSPTSQADISFGNVDRTEKQNRENKQPTTYHPEGRTLRFG